MKIGYQGIEYSNSFFIAEQFANEKEFANFELIPLVNSSNVYNALLGNQIDYGVMALYNTIGKEVLETKEVLLNNNLLLVQKYDRTINHCLFKKKQNIQIENIASHVQALKQTEKIRKEKYPNLEQIIVEDTALAAEQLKDGVLNESVAVICTKEAGVNNNLFLVSENFQDNTNNITTFGIFKIK